MTHRGRVSRIDRDRRAGGYRVWVDGARYPFVVPEARYVHYPLRVGATVHFGGYWNPLGYVAVDHFGGYPGYRPVYAARVIHGTVIRVDHHRRTLLVDDDVSARVITIGLRPGAGPMNIRRGDRVEIRGEWTRDRIFVAHRLHFIDPRWDWR